MQILYQQSITCYLIMPIYSSTNLTSSKNGLSMDEHIANSWIISCTHTVTKSDMTTVIF